MAPWVNRGDTRSGAKRRGSDRAIPLDGDVFQPCAQPGLNFVSKVRSDPLKFSYVEGMHQEEDLREWRKKYSWPISQLDTNQAYQLAASWLTAASMDVQALNRDFRVVVEAERSPGKPENFVPVYWVYWARGRAGKGSAASVRLCAPTKTLMQLRVEDPQYILRKRIQVVSPRAGSDETNQH